MDCLQRSPPARVDNGDFLWFLFEAESLEFTSAVLSAGHCSGDLCDGEAKRGSRCLCLDQQARSTWVLKAEVVCKLAGHTEGEDVLSACSPLLVSKRVRHLFVHAPERVSQDAAFRPFAFEDAVIDCMEKLRDLPGQRITVLGWLKPANTGEDGVVVEPRSAHILRLEFATSATPEIEAMRYNSPEVKPGVLNTLWTPAL